MKGLLAGAGLAAVCGVMLGGAMHPSLGVDGRPAGPQMFTGKAAERSTGPFDPGPSFARYGGALPSYVTGTDNQMAAYDAPPTYREERQLARNDAATPEREPVDYTRAAYDEPPLPVVIYPSMNGGTAYGDDPEATADESDAPVIVG
jgi:hypothetical protein